MVSEPGWFSMRVMRGTSGRTEHNRGRVIKPIVALEMNNDAMLAAMIAMKNDKMMFPLDDRGHLVNPKSA
jgi:hypothetical protein